MKKMEALMKTRKTEDVMGEREMTKETKIMVIR